MMNEQCLYICQPYRKNNYLLKKREVHPKDFFTMVEENFEISSPETLQIDPISHTSEKPWLKKILKSHCLKRRE